MQEDTAIEVRVSENLGLSRTLLGLEASMERAARENLAAVLSQGGMELGQYTELEQRAMVETEKLRLVNGLELAAIMLRGRLLHMIEDEALFTVHPMHYTTLEEMAQQQGISLSELSDTRAMYDVVFPYIENELGLSVAAVWESIGKSKFRALVPIVKALITGQEPGRESARENYRRVLDSTAASLRAANGGEPVEDREVRRQAIDDLLIAGQQMPAAAFRDHIRDGAVTPALEPYIIEAPDGRKFLLSEVDDDQLTVIQRKMGAHLAAPENVRLPRDARRRQIEAFQHSIIRELYRLIEG